MNSIINKKILYDVYNYYDINSFDYPKILNIINIENYKILRIGYFLENLSRHYHTDTHVHNLMITCDKKSGNILFSNKNFYVYNIFKSRNNKYLYGNNNNYIYIFTPDLNILYNIHFKNHFFGHYDVYEKYVTVATRNYINYNYIFNIKIWKLGKLIINKYINIKIFTNNADYTSFGDIKYSQDGKYIYASLIVDQNDIISNILLIFDNELNVLFRINNIDSSISNINIDSNYRINNIINNIIINTPLASFYEYKSIVNKYYYIPEEIYNHILNYMKNIDNHTLFIL
jgi:hypothetical protein